MVDSQPMEEEIRGAKARNQSKTKAMLRRLAYSDSDEEAQTNSFCRKKLEDSFQEQGTITPEKVKKVGRPE
nr:hypothetical protein [Tanacetum cinerariifolium]